MARGAMQEYFGKVRAYVAPVNRTTETATIFDPAVSCRWRWRRVHIT